ncbi:MAG: DUF1156 domain-containing protein [Methanobacterium sp.]
MAEKRTLIETFLPVEEISAEAKKEKKGRAPTFELHYWWTRKPLVAARATVLGALLPENFDIKEFKRLLGLSNSKRAHNYDLSRSQIENLEKKYVEVWETEKPLILDPFAGGGSIPFEALRVGCETQSNDYNPVAYLIQKATIKYPAKHGKKLYKDVENGLNWIFNKANEQMKEFYPKHDGKNVSTYIYAWMVSCPDCGFKTPLVGKWWLSNIKNKKIYLQPSVVDDKLKIEIKNGDDVPDKTVVNGKGKCLKCGSTIPNKNILEEIVANEEEKLIAVALSGDNGKEYALPTDSDLKAINKANSYFKENWDAFLKEDLIPIEEMPKGDIRSARYLKYWYKLLNPRQRILFATLIQLIREYKEILKDSGSEEYTNAIITYLTFILGKHVSYNCRSTTWIQSRELVANIFSFRRPSMHWDHTEVNPFVKTSGSLVSVNRAILRSLKYSIDKLSKADPIIENKSILESNFKAQIIVTDPPYFDDVQYAELSELFYILEKRAYNSNSLPIETPKNEDLSVSSKRSKKVFKHLFNLSCQKMNEMLFDNGLLVMYFAHSSVEAWDFVVNSLRDAGFRITATWPIHTESADNPLAKGKASIMSSIVIVARKRKEDKTGYIEEIKGDVEKHLEKRLQEFWDYGLRGADITVSAMGATLDILTQYSEIKSYTGEMTVKDILELVEIYVVEYILEKFLKNSESLDSATRFYTYCRLSELGGMSFDTANLISKSLNIDLKSLESSGNINSITTGTKKGIKLLKFNEREAIEIKSLIDAVQISMLAYDKGGMKEFESALVDVPYDQNEIFNILKSFQHLEPGDPEKQIALQILGKSADFIPEKGQTTLD